MLNSPSASEVIEATAPAVSDFEIRSGAFTVSDEWDISLPALFGRPDGPSCKVVSLGNLPLPPTPFNNAPTSIAARDDLRIACLKCLDEHLSNIPPSKSRHEVARNLLSTLAKIFEFGWIRGIYRISDWRQKDFDDLALALSAGSWYDALEVERRCNQMLEQMNGEQRRSLWSIRRYSASMDVNLSTDALQPLASNAAHWHRLRARGHLAAKCVADIPELALVLQKEFARNPKPGAGLLEAMRAANLLARTAQGLKFVPFPNPTLLKRRLIPPTRGRTRTIGPEELAGILGRSHWWVFTLGPVLIRFLQWLAPQAENYRGFPQRLNRLLEAAPLAQELSALLGQRVQRSRNSREPGSLGLGDVVQGFFCAAMALIAVLNARRKDEIIHPTLGLTARSLNVVDNELGVFLCSFYIEKSIREHVPFYVGPMTKQIIDLLSEVARVAKAFGGRASTVDTDSLFLVPVVTAYEHDPVRWFRVPAMPSKKMTAHPFKTQEERKVATHTFRRAHAVLYIYRFEGQFEAAMQQLGHLELESTRTYVTDTPLVAADQTIEALYGRLTPSQRKAIQTERLLLEEEIRVVGNERLIQFIEQVMLGVDDTSGGYGRLVQRFAQATSGSIVYKRSSVEERAKRLGEALIEKGHRPLPFRHGTCMAGETTSRLRGHCHSEELNGLERSLASPIVCGRCPYHFVTAQHLRNLENELDASLKTLESGSAVTLRSRALSQDVKLLRSMIDHHRRRLDSLGTTQ
ncbi:MAG: hypothetical protein Tsb007_37450 [Rhizobacter sp.]